MPLTFKFNLTASDLVSMVISYNAIRQLALATKRSSVDHNELGLELVGWPRIVSAIGASHRFSCCAASATERKSGSGHVVPVSACTGQSYGESIANNVVPRRVAELEFILQHAQRVKRRVCHPATTAGCPPFLGYR